MIRSALLRFWLALGCIVALGVLSGCEIVSGIKDRTLARNTVEAGPDGNTDGNVEAGDAGDAGNTGDAGDAGLTCTLPTTGDATIRIANYVPSFTNVDVCIKSSNTSSWKGVKSLLTTFGGGCTPFGYKDVSVALPYPSGVYDFKFVDASAPDCTGTGLGNSATLQQVVINANQAYTIGLYGDGSGPSTAKAMPESGAQGVNSVFQFINGIQGGGNLDCGLAADVSLPTTMVTVIFKDMAFASPAPAGPVPGGGAIDQNGYYSVNLGGGAVNLGVAPTGNANVAELASVKLDTSTPYEITAVGKPKDPNWPEEILSCNLLAASSANPLFAKCGGQPVDLTAQVFNAQLQGVFTAYVKERSQPVADNVAKLSKAGVICTTEVWQDSEKQKIINAAKSLGYNGVYFQTTDDTPVDDPTDQSGNTPPAPTNPPCYNSTAAFETALTCAEQCSTNQTSPSTGSLEPTGTCDLSQKCSGKILPLLIGTPDDKACWSCMFTHLASYASFDATKQACENDPKARFAFNGANGVVLLSKYKVTNAERWVLPATEYRVVVIRAPITLTNDADVDVYCTVLTTPADSVSRPYTGAYGGGATSAKDAWKNELLLQTNKLIAYVKLKSTSVGRKAVILGDFYTGPQNSTSKLSAVNVESFNNLIKGFGLGVTNDFAQKPSCTFCADNPLVAGGSTQVQNTWTSNIFLGGIAESAVKSTDVNMKDAVVDLSKATPPIKNDTPLSSYYGLQSVITIKP